MTASSTAHKGPLSAVSFVVLVRASLKKERKHTAQGRDGRTARRHHTAHRDFKERSVVLVCCEMAKERKKEPRQPKGGMGGRHAATTQGF